MSKEKFYFAMGSMEPNKNFKWIAEVAVKMPDDVFAVAGSINEKVFSEGIGFKCPQNMKLLGFVSDEEAKTLMRDCKGFLFPSIYEGFGIPPLEAMSAGCKRIYVSNTDVMHEIFDSAVKYINSYDCLDENIKADNLKYSDVLSKYSWKKSAEAIKYFLSKKL